MFLGTGPPATPAIQPGEIRIHCCVCPRPGVAGTGIVFCPSECIPSGPVCSTLQVLFGLFSRNCRTQIVLSSYGAPLNEISAGQSGLVRDGSRRRGDGRSSTTAFPTGRPSAGGTAFCAAAAAPAAATATGEQKDYHCAYRTKTAEIHGNTPLFLGGGINQPRAGTFRNANAGCWPRQGIQDVPSEVCRHQTRRINEIPSES